MKVVEVDTAPAAIGPYSQAIINGDMVFTSGQIPLDLNGNIVGEDVATQTKQVLENLSNVLEGAGSGLSKVIKTTIFLSDMDNFGTVNEVYGSYFSEHKPARSTVAVKTLPKNVMIEIEAIASL